MQGVECLPDFIDRLPELDLPLAGVRGWTIQGRGQQVVFLRFDETVEVPDHEHEEQWEFVVAGEVHVRQGGVRRTYRAGDNFFVPAGVVHGATVPAGYQALVVFNAPERYKPKT
jgi:quercetin dioxygenase-like cupin family protein